MKQPLQGSRNERKSRAQSKRIGIKELMAPLSETWYQRGLSGETSQSSKRLLIVVKSIDGTR